MAKRRILHCWQSGPDGCSTCMLEEHGPELEHAFTPDDEIRMGFGPSARYERDEMESEVV